VIANEQRAAALGYIVAAQDFDSIDRMRYDPQNESQQRIRQQPRRINSANEGGHAAEQKNLQRIEMQYLRQQIMNRPNQERPTNDNRFAAASTSPFFSLGGRC